MGVDKGKHTMIILRDKNGNPLGSTVQVSPTAGGLDVYCTSGFDGGALNANWVLKPSGTFTFPSKVHGTSTASPSAPSYFGTLSSFQAPEYVQTIAMNGTNMVTFQPNMPSIAVKT